jgi:hypothetical protein
MDIETEPIYDPETSILMAVNAVRLYLHRARIEGREEKRFWIADVAARATAAECGAN